MRITFRQGLVKVPANFLQLSSGSVNLFAQPTEPLYMAFADGTSDYLNVERLPVTSAWPGPFVANTDYYLYVDLNLVTGVRTFGSTALEPIDGGSAPVSPANDQHFFDTSKKQMFVYNSTAGRFVHVVRVFMAKLTGNVFVSMSINSPIYTGTQVGSLSSTPVAAGALVYDADGRVVRRANGTFFTTEDVAVTGMATSSHVKLEAVVLSAQAQANITAFSVVRFTGFGMVAPASSTLLNPGAFGIVETQAVTGDVVDITVEGIIINPAWDWSTAGINAPLFVDSFGQLTATQPTNPIVVATVIAQDSILMRPTPVELHADVALGTPNQLLGVDAAGVTQEYKSLFGTTQQIVVTNTAGAITLSFDTIDGGSI